MRLLYVSHGHPLQEADDCLMWDKLGIDWFSTGHYIDSEKPGILPRIPHKIRHDLIEELQRGVCQLDQNSSGPTIIRRHQQFASNTNVKNVFKFTTEFLTNFDIVLFNHDVGNILSNLRAIDESKVRVMLKLFGMHPVRFEKEIYDLRTKKGVYIIRNSSVEHMRIPENSDIEFGGCDIVIRGSIVPDEHTVSGWIGNKKQVITLSNSMNHHPNIRRRYYCEIYDRINKRYPMILHGSDNDNEPLSGGFISEKAKIKLLKESRVSLCIGTPGSNNTYSMVEAWVMGIPVVAFSKEMWQSPAYEVDQLIDHEKNGFIANSPIEASAYITQLMEDEELAQIISKNAREKAVSIYGRDVLVKLWKQVLDDNTCGRINITKKKHRKCTVQARIQK